MSFVETQFPVEISYGAVGGPRFSTDIVRNFGGYEQRNINWSFPLGEWNVAHGVKTPAQLDALQAFFWARKGRAVGFRFKDWSDYEVTAGNIGTGDGSTAAFQLRKQYTSGGVTINRSIVKPVSGSLVVYVNGSQKTAGTHYNADFTTGIVTFTGGNIPTSGQVITADFAFDVPARFDTDKLDISLDSFGVGSWANIPVVELRA